MLNLKKAAGRIPNGDPAKQQLRHTNQNPKETKQETEREQLSNKVVRMEKNQDKEHKEKRIRQKMHPYLRNKRKQKCSQKTRKVDRKEKQ